MPRAMSEAWLVIWRTDIAWGDQDRAAVTPDATRWTDSKVSYATLDRSLWEALDTVRESYS